MAHSARYLALALLVANQHFARGAKVAAADAAGPPNAGALPPPAQPPAPASAERGGAAELGEAGAPPPPPPAPADGLGAGDATQPFFFPPGQKKKFPLVPCFFW